MNPPIQSNPELVNSTSNADNDTISTNKNPTSWPVSCLRRSISSENNNSLIKPGLRVNFPEDDRNLVTAYLEPTSPWDSLPSSPQDLRVLYEESCEKHGTKPLEQILDQLENCLNTLPTLSLKCNLVDLSSLESLEPLLKRVRFDRLLITTQELPDDAAIALFDMLEYYECAAALTLCCSIGIGIRSWQACSRMLKKTYCLMELDVTGTPINEQIMLVLCRALKVGSNLTSLQLGRSGIEGRTLTVLMVALRLNTQLQELTLSDNDLSPMDAAQLGGLLRENTTLRYLDVSNNGIEDAGFASICEALAEQRHGHGLHALVAWNTRLTRASASLLASVLLSNSPLETINIGQNEIGSEGLIILKDALLRNQSLKQLGLQCARVTCTGASMLATIMAANATLQRIDARSNAIGRDGLIALRDALVAGAQVQRIDLDANRGELSELVEEIRELCRLNEARALVEVESASVAATTAWNYSRKISLTCETLMRRGENRALLCEPRRFSGAGAGRLRSPEPSPVPSPSSSPIPTPPINSSSPRTGINRFQVSRVNENTALSPSTPIVSRFRVSVVEPTTTVRIEAPTPSPEPPSHVHVGFDAKPTTPLPTVKSATVTTPPVLTPTPTRQRKLSAPNQKPQSSIDKLLGLFQNPASFFGSVTLSSEKDKVSVGGGAGAEESNWEWDFNGFSASKDVEQTCATSNNNA